MTTSSSRAAAWRSAASRILVFAVILICAAPRVAGQQSVQWASTDIGKVSLPGWLTIWQEGTYSVTGSGADIWRTADQFHFAYVELPHDGFIEARVTGIDATQAWAKAGVMIRQSLTPESRHDSFFIT